MKADCDDKSDEVSCQIVHLEPGYFKESAVFTILVIKIIKKTSKADTITLQDTPPPPLEVGSLVKIFVNVDIKRILTISEVGE